MRATGASEWLLYVADRQGLYDRYKRRMLIELDARGDISAYQGLIVQGAARCPYTSRAQGRLHPNVECTRWRRGSHAPRS